VRQQRGNARSRGDAFQCPAEEEYADPPAETEQLRRQGAEKGASGHPGARSNRVGKYPGRKREEQFRGERHGAQRAHQRRPERRSVLGKMCEIEPYENTVGAPAIRMSALPMRATGSRRRA
jgi:hypothetical protein